MKLSQTYDVIIQKFLLQVWARSRIWIIINFFKKIDANLQNQLSKIFPIYKYLRSYFVHI